MLNKKIRKWRKKVSWHRLWILNFCFAKDTPRSLNVWNLQEVAAFWLRDQCWRRRGRSSQNFSHRYLYYDNCWLGNVNKWRHDIVSSAILTYCSFWRGYSPKGGPWNSKLAYVFFAFRLKKASIQFWKKIINFGSI